MMNRFVTTTATLLLFFSSSLVFAQTFTPIPQFPTPAAGSFTVVGTALGDGRFVLWNGDEVFVQISAGSGLFTSVASGFPGDPSFATLSPDGTTLMLGGGFTPKLYRLDVDHWQDHSPAMEIDVPTHYAGAFLNSSLMALDRSTDDFSATEIVVVDVSGSKADAQPRRVIKGLPLPKDVVIDKPPFSFSSAVAVDDALQTLYVMDGATRELRTFAVADVINAYNSSGTLDWTTDGTLIGMTNTYFNGGVSGILSNGNLVIGGAEGFLLPGGIHIVNPATGAIEATLDPTGTEAYVTVIFNGVTDGIIALDGATFAAYGTSGSIGSLPALSAVGLALLLGVALWLGSRRLSLLAG